MIHAVALIVGIAISPSLLARPVIYANGGPLTQEWAQLLAERFTTCFGLLGPDNLFPQSESIPNPAEMLVTIEYPPSPFLVNGARYTFMIHGKSNSAYALRSGGFSGAQEYFGPIPLTSTCPTTKVRSCEATI